MKGLLRHVLTTAAIALLCATGARATDWWASEAVGWSRLGASPYDDPLAALGKPAVWMNASGAPGDPDPCAVMLVSGAWGLGWPGGGKLVTTVKARTATLPAGHIAVRFATPIYDDPSNWHGRDFIVFGNAAFTTTGSYVYADANMEETTIVSAGGSGGWEPMPVSVSQDGITWYPYANGPYADDYAPAHALAWDWVENTWLRNSAGECVELDFTRPVSPGLSAESFDRRSAAEGIDMYRGSGGGTAFDLHDLPLPTDPATGLKWIQYVRVEGAMGEVDAFARVSHRIGEASIGAARQLPDGSRVVLRECAVSAATYETGRCCYVEHQDRSGGIRVMGRVLERGKRYIIYGDMDTAAGERVIRATAVELAGELEDPLRPLAMPNRSLAGAGLSTTGLLVKTWGRVESVNTTDKSFVIGDGSGAGIKCLPPRLTPSESDSPNPGNPDWGTLVHPEFTPPSPDQFVAVTGISSLELGEQNQVTPVIRLRDLNSVSD